MSDDTTTMKPRRGFRSIEVASFVAQLDDQNELLLHDLEGIRPAELAWQSGPGVNTIGMLLAHIAIVEVFWVQVGLRVMKRAALKPVLGVGILDDGLPLSRTAAPPRDLQGKTLSFYRGLLRRARVYTVRETRAIEDGALDGRLTRRRRDGARHDFNRRWVLYHMLEHQAGHYGQILLLRHLHRDLAPPRVTSERKGA